jgi:prepilin-type processing-associated H-X9-DG protein
MVIRPAAPLSITVLSYEFHRFRFVTTALYADGHVTHTYGSGGGIDYFRPSKDAGLDTPT